MTESETIAAILDEVRAIRASLESRSRPATSPAPVPGGAVFPNYGRSKGQPIAGASRGDLDYYASGCRRSLDDPAKSRWHDKERALLAAIEAELERQWGGGGQRQEQGPPPDESEIPF